MEEREYEDFITRDITSDETLIFQDWVLDSYSTSQNKETFEYLRYSPFNTFFTNSKVDTPRCLLGTWSSRRKINKHLLLKFSNYIMRKGKRTKTLDVLLYSITSSYNKTLTTFSSKQIYLD